MTKQKEYYSMISTPIHISESEIAFAYPQYNANWLTENLSDLNAVLFDLGLDTSKHYQLQEVTQHRNRLGKVVVCGRYLGTERDDTDWMQSGFASQAAKDKAKNSRMLDDLYREKALTIDAQAALERKDMFASKTEDESEDW